MPKSFDENAEMLFDTFVWSYNEQADDLDRLIELQKTHDNVFDDSKWPTQSKIPLALAWSAVEQAVAPAMDYLYPSQPFASLLPLDDVDQDVVDKMEWALYIMMAYRMRLKDSTFRAVKDCFKIGIGYGIVEPVVVTPPAVFEITAGGQTTRQVRPGSPQTSLRFGYRSAGKVLPYPTGTDFNGEDATPFGYLLDLPSEDQFRAMYEKDAISGEPMFKGGKVEMEAIIAESRSHGFNCTTGFTNLADELGGRKSYARGGQSQKKNVKAIIPILKCYADNRHTFLFCGSKRHVLFDREGGMSTMRKPLIKFDAWRDSDRWYPMSQPEADQRNVWAKNVWFNLFFDLATLALKRTLIYDNSEFDGPPVIDPDGSIGMPGPVDKMAAYLDPPGIEQSIVSIGAEIDGTRRAVTGQGDPMEKNFTRGGSLAFESLMQSSTARERLRMALLQTGGVESIARQTLIYMQTEGANMNGRFQRPAINETTKREYVDKYEVTEEDLQHAYDLVLDMDDKHRNGGMDAQMGLQIYDRQVASEFYDQYEVAKDLCTDSIAAQRKVLPREEVKRKQEAKEAAQLEAMRTQRPQGGGGEPGIGQAVVGAEAGGAAQ